MTKKQILNNIAIIELAIEQNELWLATVKKAKPSEIVEMIKEIDYLKSTLEKAKSLKKLQ
jgi:hypothetical protein